MRIVLPLLSVLAVAACQTRVPESGVGFGDYQSYLNNREGQLAGKGVDPMTVPTVANTGAAIAAETVTSAPLGAAGTTLPAPVIAAPVVAPLPTGAPLGTPAPLATTGSTTMASSTAVAGATDPSAPLPASILAAVGEPPSATTTSAAPATDPAAAPVIAAAAPVPSTAPVSASTTNPDGSPNLVVYALNAPNRLGQSYYTRAGDSGSSAKACKRYSSSDMAQSAFLDQGGPQVDGKNLDPDGDGFACAWDPTPFQKAREQ